MFPKKDTGQKKSMCSKVVKERITIMTRWKVGKMILLLKRRFCIYEHRFQLFEICLHGAIAKRCARLGYQPAESSAENFRSALSRAIIDTFIEIFNRNCWKIFCGRLNLCPTSPTTHHTWNNLNPQGCGQVQRRGTRLWVSPINPRTRQCSCDLRNLSAPPGGHHFVQIWCS